jgi:hypothetical protein
MTNYSSTNITALEKKVNGIFQLTHESMFVGDLTDLQRFWLPQHTGFQNSGRMISNSEMMIKRLRIYRQTYCSILLMLTEALPECDFVLEPRLSIYLTDP